MLDIFNDDAFSVVNLSIRMNDLPFVPGQLGASGLFESDSIDKLHVGIERRNNGLGLIGTSARGGPGEVIKHDRDDMRLFPVPHFQRDDSVMADEVTGRREFGTENDVETVLGRIDRKAQRHYRDMDATLEHQRVGAIKGIITDKNGKTLYNLFNEFGISAPAPIYLDLANSAINMRSKTLEVIFRIEDELDAPYSGIDAWLGRDAWKLLIDHKSIRETYLNTAQAAELRGKPETDQFEFGGIVWKRYKTGQKATAANGGAPFIGLNEIRFVPRGVPDLFITRFAPADYVETVNQDGLPRYAKQFAMPNDKGVNLEFQMNPISICTRPQLLFAGSVAASG